MKKKIQEQLEAEFGTGDDQPSLAAPEATELDLQPEGDDTTVYEEDGSQPSLADIQSQQEEEEAEARRAAEEDAQMQQEAERQAAEEAQRIQMQQEASGKAQAIAFRDTRIIEVFQNQFAPLLEMIYAENPEKAQRYIEDGVNILFLTGLMADAGVDLSGRDFSTEDIEKLAPHVAKRIQHNLNLLRPRGKENARLEYVKEFEGLAKSHGFHVRGPNGFIGLTCYEFLKGNEEYITFRINPKVVTDYSFMGEEGLNIQGKAAQANLPTAIVTLSWDELANGIIKAPKYELVNGYHPKAKNPSTQKSEIQVDRITREPQRLMHLNDSPDAIFDGITKAAREHFPDAVALCSQFGVDPNSIAQVMNGSGYGFDQNNNRFVQAQPQQTPTQTFNQETSVMTNQQPQQSPLGSELSSLAQFLPPQ